MTEKGSITVTERDNVDGIDVLVVDDDAAIREIVARVPRKSGYACRSASDASEALEEATRRTPMLTISDVRWDLGSQGAQKTLAGYGRHHVDGGHGSDNRGPMPQGRSRRLSGQAHQRG